MVKPPFCRVGGKTSLRKVIVPRIPEHKTYVEPFVGKGDIFFNKKPAEKSVINDLDKRVIRGLKLVKVASSDPAKYNFINSFEEANRFVKTNPASNEQKLLKEMMISCGTFGNSGKGQIYRLRDNSKIIKNMPEYKELLKNTTILNQDYKGVLRKYDSPSTFFYLDPPYEKSDTDKLYEKGEMNYDEFARVVKGLKGKWLISLNDSKRIRDLFKGYKIKGVRVEGTAYQGIGSKARKEVIITNY